MIYQTLQAVLEASDIIRVSPVKSVTKRARVAIVSPDNVHDVTISMTDDQARQLVRDLQALIDRDFAPEGDNVLRFPVPREMPLA